MDSSIIYKHFSDLSPAQCRQLDMLGELYTLWNTRINVVSRKDIGNLYTNHVLHSLSIAAFLGPLATGTTMLDLGTGGGFPGIPLAVMYPQARFHLIDRIGKKITVAREIAAAIGLQNVTLQHGDAGECHDRYTYVVSRAVMPLNDLWRLVRRNLLPPDRTLPGNRYAPGLVCLKGGDLAAESRGIDAPVAEYPVTEFIDEPRFTDKYIVYIPSQNNKR